MRSLTLLSGLAVLALPAMGQVGDQVPTRIFGARSLALSPSGDQLAFTWRGDVWVAPASGGRATAITTHVEMDDNPLWSPDGQWIAFSSTRHGGSDIFVAPVNGGPVRRITYHPGSETPSSWTPDSREIVFRAQREGLENQIFSIDIRTLALKQHLRDNRTVGSPRVGDGKILYTRYGFPWSRPRYQGSAASQLMILDTASGRRTSFRDNEFQHLWADFNHRGEVVAVTATEVTPSASPIDRRIPKVVDNVNRTPNVYLLQGLGQQRRLTNFVGGSVRFLTAARKADAMAFEYEGEVYRMSAASQPVRIPIEALVDDKENNEERRVLTTGATEAALSPDNSTFVITGANELWSVPVRQGTRPNSRDARQLTEWPGLDRDPIFHPDGKSVFFTSDREGSERLYRLNLETKAIAPITSLDHDVLDVQLMPGGTRLSFWIAGKSGGLFTVSVTGGPVRQVFSFPRPFRWESDTSHAWSPDERYVAYARRQPAASVNIWIYDTQTQKQTNVTRISAMNGSPRFSPDGRFLYFVGDRGETGIQVVPLRQEDVRTDDVDLKYEEPKETPKVEAELDDITSRIRLFASGGAFNLRTDRKNGALLFLRDGQIWTVGYDGQGARAITSGSGIGSFEFSQDGNSLVFVRDGLPQFLNLRAQQLPVTTVQFRADWTRDVRGERRAAFYQFWREYNRGFYDANFHGRDWVSIRERYEPFLASVGHRSEMATVLNMMVGELEASHAEVSSAPGGVSAESVAHLGLTFDYSHSGPGIKVQDVPRRTPGSFEKTRIRPGEFILAINGQDVGLNERLWSEVLVGQEGRDVTLLVNGTATKEGAREVKFRAISSGAFQGILYRNRIEDRRRYVEQQSNGDFTYLDIAGMGQGNLRTFNFEAWELIAGKKGIIIDVRNNGGGNISDDLVDLIERRPSYFYFLRDTEATPVPDRSWRQDLEVVVLMGETSFSDAEIFPSAMRSRGFASLVGMPTPGYVIGTYGLGLVDGTGARMPAWGVYRLDGSNMENIGEKPDHRVPWLAEDYLAGRDRQLDKALEVLRGKSR